ncbi:MAG: DMT family transporter [Geovibrio sp.]|nr:DMT family transporter [Geovibrio sp.]
MAHFWQRCGRKSGNPALGNVMELGAMVCAAGYMVLTRRLSAKFNPWVLTLIQVASGVLFFSGGAVDAFHAEWIGRVITAVVYLGVFVTVGAFGLYNWGISKVPATRAAFINLVPVFAVFMGWGILGESLGVSQLAGSAVIAAGVFSGAEEKIE